MCLWKSLWNLWKTTREKIRLGLWKKATDGGKCARNCEKRRKEE